MQRSQSGENRKGIRLNKADIILLLFLFAISFILRLYIARGYNFRFLDDTSYFHIREAEYIKEHFKPFFYDRLSFSGHEIAFASGFDYLLALFLLFFNANFVFNILPKLLASLIVLPVYFITLKLTKNRTASLFSALSAVSMPLFFGLTTNSVTPLNISIFLIFMLIYYFIDLQKNDKSVIPFFISLLLCIFTTALTLAVAVSMLFYLLFLKIEKFKKIEKEFEITIFSLVISFFVFLLVFKESIITNGYSVMIGNTPKMFLFNYLNTNPLQILYLIGLVPLLMSIHAFYIYLFNDERKGESRSFYLLFSLVLIILILGIANIIGFSYSTSVLSVIFAIMAGVSYKNIISVIKKTKLHRYRKIVSALLFLILLLDVPIMLSYSKNLIQQSPNKAEIELMSFIRDNTEKNSVILAKLPLGNLITCLGERKDVLDSLFLGVKDINKRIADINRVYTEVSEVESLKIMNKYNADYIICENKEPMYIDDKTCFDKVYSKSNVSLYKIKCGVE